MSVSTTLMNKMAFPRETFPHPFTITFFQVLPPQQLSRPLGAIERGQFGGVDQMWVKIRALATCLPNPGSPRALALGALAGSGALIEAFFADGGSGVLAGTAHAPAADRCAFPPATYHSDDATASQPRALQRRCAPIRSSDSLAVAAPGSSLLRLLNVSEAQLLQAPPPPSAASTQDGCMCRRRARLPRARRAAKPDPPSARSGGRLTSSLPPAPRGPSP